jgi:hypothetical protein
MSAINTYTIDITKTDASHFIRTVVLTKEQFDLVNAYIAYCNTNAVSCTAASITLIPLGSNTSPIHYDALKLQLEQNVPLGNKKHTVPKLD